MSAMTRVHPIRPSSALQCHISSGLTGGSVFMPEPNIKNGCGGLRDYHNMQWICYFRDGVMSTSKLVERKYISESDRRAIDRAYDFLLRVRTELHYLSKRPSDLLNIQWILLSSSVACGRSVTARSNHR